MLTVTHCTEGKALKMVDRLGTITINVRGNQITEEIENKWVVQIFVACLKLSLQCRAVYVN